MAQWDCQCLQCQDTDSTPAHCSGLKYSTLPQLQPRSQLCLRSDTWPGSSIYCGATKKEKKIKLKKKKDPKCLAAEKQTNKQAKKHAGLSTALFSRALCRHHIVFPLLSQIAKPRVSYLRREHTILGSGHYLATLYLNKLSPWLQWMSR